MKFRLVDNGGQRGTNTGLGASGLFDLTVGNGAILTAPSNSTFRNLLIASNAWLTASNGQLLQVITSNAVIQACGAITLDGLGSPGGQGPGVGGVTTNTQAFGYTAGGGGHGGYGGVSIANAPGGNSYGSILQPTDQGSGGGSPIYRFGGAGGGVMKLSVTGTLTLDGKISADGADAPHAGGGGGSGGSIWLSVGTLSGSGLISANGGAGDYLQSGGGGGGRIAVYYATNLLSGRMRAFGGAGAAYGGAGTIYTRADSDAVGKVLVDNAGSDGTNTPLTAPEAFALTISGGAVVHPSVPGLVLGGLLIDSGATLTQLSAESNLDLLVFGNAVVQTNGSLSVHAKGYSGDAGGPGAGLMLANSGSGGGYGGTGGASASGTPGGSTYGSATQPIDLGSRGGLSPAYPGFSQGGGAVLMRVAGTLTVNGHISADGNAALVEGAGGGAGGSIWVTTRAIDGFGSITANGGQGEANGGGGGGGGRIAIYSRTNSFVGATSAAGGAGANPGQDGTLLITNISAPQIIAQFPACVVNSMVSYVDLTFGSSMNLGTASSADFALDTPNGFVPNNTLTVSAADFSGVRLSFPGRNTVGYYEVQAGPQIEDIYGQPMAGTYTGSFVILAPAISGRVLDANGLPVPYVTLRPDGGLLSEVTDSSGSYALEVPPSWAGTVTPSKGAALFIPASHTYTNVTANLINQDFILLNSEALTLTSQKQGPNLVLTWYGINGVSYQLVYSSDLVNWLPFDSGLLLGTNGPMTLPLPIGPDKAKFFRFSANY